MTVRVGLLPERTGFFLFVSRDEADSFARKHPAGTEISDNAETWQDLPEVESDFRKILDSGGPFGLEIGDGESPLVFETLTSAGLTDYYPGNPTSIVLNRLGSDRIQKIKAQHGDNWNVAAVFEYCWLYVSHSSPAYVAAAYQFYFYIKEDDLSAGYLWRDLEILTQGVETTAVKFLEMRKRAGSEGSRTSRKAREARRSEIFQAIEQLFIDNPIAKSIGVKAIATVALERCVQENPSLWSQGKNQVTEYLNEIRRGEAGEELKSRYIALFGDKPPKRSA